MAGVIVAAMFAICFYAGILWALLGEVDIKRWYRNLCSGRSTRRG